MFTLLSRVTTINWVDNKAYSFVWMLCFDFHWQNIGEGAVVLLCSIKQLQVGHVVAVEDLDPVAIRIGDESKSFHLPVVGSLYKLHSQLLKAFACLIDIGNWQSWVVAMRHCELLVEERRQYYWSNLPMWPNPRGSVLPLWYLKASSVSVPQLWVNSKVAGCWNSLKGKITFENAQKFYAKYRKIRTILFFLALRLGCPLP